MREDAVLLKHFCRKKHLNIKLSKLAVQYEYFCFVALKKLTNVIFLRIFCAYLFLYQIVAMFIDIIREQHQIQ